MRLVCYTKMPPSLDKYIIIIIILFQYTFIGGYIEAQLHNCIKFKPEIPPGVQI